MREALGERVKGLALLGGVGNEKPTPPDLHGTLKLIERDIGILFDLHSSCFLMRDAASEVLQAVDYPDRDTSLLTDISFSLEPERSLAANAFLTGRLRVSFEPNANLRLAVADRQLIRLLGADGLIYLPLYSATRGLGLLAIGLDSPKWLQLKQHSGLLQLFANEAATTLSNQLAQQGLEQERLTEERDAIRLEARKIVHEANNPLGIITNYLHILGIKLGQEHPVQEELHIMKEEIERVGKIILRMRDIPHELEQPGHSVKLNELITDLFKLFESSLFTTHNIESTLVLDDKIPPLSINRGHLKQILTNLVKNAVEAMQDGGHLTVTTHDGVHLNGATYFEILLQDDGPGIPDEIMQQLFSPVISTKDNTHSGLGLAIVKNLVDELSGSISCSSSPESGTRFQLLLPRTTQDAVKAEKNR
jgi:signal transduction histidine kinase